MNQSPKISVIVPIYNSEQYLQQSVGSLLRQTFKDIEIILVNDGSPDNSGIICDEYASKDARVKVLHQKNAGAVRALNNGTAIAKGDFLIYLDADDWLETTTCEVAYQTAITNNADIVFWPFIKEFPDKSLTEQTIFDNDQIFVEEDLNWLRRRMTGLIGQEMNNPTRTDAINSGWGKLIRRAIIVDNNVQWTDTNLVGSSDVLFNMHYFIYIKKAVYIRHFFSHYRQDNPHSLTKNYKFTLLNKYINLFDAIDKHINTHHLDTNFRQALNNRTCISMINIALSVTGKRHRISIKETLKYLRSALDNPVYTAAFSKFDTTHLPIHWKLFFICCKKRFSFGVFILALIMQKMR